MSAMLDAALRRKEEVKWYYERHAVAGIAEVAQIFSLFAEDEKRHGIAMRSLWEGSPTELEHSPTLDRAKPLLRRMVSIDAPQGACAAETQVFCRAMNFEAENVGIYYEMALKAPDGWQRELLLKIAAEEETHFSLLEEMRELLCTCSSG